MKFKCAVYFFAVSLLSALLFLVSGCHKEESKNVRSSIKGVAQKGPFVKSSKVTLYELNSVLEQTGRSFSTQIAKNDGSFEIDKLELASNFVEISVEGYYYNEVNGSETDSPLVLYAMSDLSGNSKVNVNIITSLERPRVKHLVAQGKKFNEAKKMAHSEVLGIFGFETNPDQLSESLDISSNEEENAALLAISILVQKSNMEISDLTTFLYQLGDEIKENGVLKNDSITSILRQAGKSIIMQDLRANIENRYSELGLKVILPAFEKYLRVFMAGSDTSTTVITRPISGNGTNAVLEAQVFHHEVSTIVKFEYGLTTAYGDSTSPIIADSQNGQIVQTYISGLLPATIYHYRAKGENILGKFYGHDIAFATSGKLPSILPSNGRDPDTTHVTLAFLVSANNLATDCTIEWGTTTSYGQNSGIFSFGNYEGDYDRLEFALSNLHPYTLYHYRLKAINALGTVYSDDRMFTTLGSPPTVYDTRVSWATENSIILNAGVKPNGLATNAYFEYGLTESYGNRITPVPSRINISGPVKITFQLTGLAPLTTYHFRAVATNSAGKTTGEDEIFITLPSIPPALPVTDIDGNVYQTVRIGNQVWMTRNLLTARFRNGDVIPTTVPLNLDITGEINPIYQWPAGGDTSYLNDYGRLYTGYAVNDSRQLCPSGFHIPSAAEFDVLVAFVGQADFLKEAGSAHWYLPNSGTNLVGFSAVGSGSRERTYFVYFKYFCYFFTFTSATSTEQKIYSLEFNGSSMVKLSWPCDNVASIRCIRDY